MKYVGIYWTVFAPLIIFFSLGTVQKLLNHFPQAIFLSARRKTQAMLALGNSMALVGRK